MRLDALLSLQIDPFRLEISTDAVMIASSPMRNEQVVYSTESIEILIKFLYAILAASSDKLSISQAKFMWTFKLPEAVHTSSNNANHLQKCPRTHRVLCGAVLLSFANSIVF